MCHQCDYAYLLEKSGLGPTPKRLKVLEVIGNNNCPLSAHEIFETLSRTNSINRVTIYRILDLLVEKGLVDRISSGGRSFHYGLAPNENHHPHPHFYCKHCGNMECLDPKSLYIDTALIHRTFPGLIQNVEVRFDGICKNCVRNERKIITAQESCH
jgi:Fur family ferric uptake transcriptional regulator